MSATGRGTEREENDVYETPGWATDIILRELPPARWAIDPSAGSGLILDRLGVHAANLAGFDVDKNMVAQAQSRGHSVTCRDALDDANWGEPDLVVMNPPYRLALQFVQRAIAEVAPRYGTVAALLRLNWLAGQRRRAFHQQCPSDVYVLAKRPSFIRKSYITTGTDATDYGWFVWGPSRGNRWFVR